MSKHLPRSVQNLIDEFARLPGIGPKSAQRLAVHLLRTPEMKLRGLGDAVLGLRDGVIFCESCWNIAESSPCKVCTERDSSTICVVEDVLDVVALERTGEYKGVYHVLHGALSPIDGVGPEELKLRELFARVSEAESNGEAVSELILATNPSLEGEATALYIQKHLAESGICVTRIARGLPVGGDLEYADSVTLSRALNGRGDF